MRISENTINLIRESIDIVEVVSTYLPLKRTGVNFRALCPFHTEKTPSFFVSPAKQIFHCFGCGKGGDVIKFVSEIEGINYYEAAIKLAKDYNIAIEYEDSSEYIKLTEVASLAGEFYHKKLLNSLKKESVSSFIKKRGIDPYIIEKFYLGFSDNPTELVDYLKSRGVDIDVAAKIGVVKGDGGKYYDAFRNRFIFPIRNLRGEIIGFGGRVINDNDMPKYLNSPESPIYIKRKSLYGIFENSESIKKEKEAIFVEGYMDLVSMHAYGVKNCVASLGTSITEAQIKLIKRFTDKFFFFYDGDKAGIKASVRGAVLCINQDIIPKIIALPEGVDPDDFIKKEGVEAFYELKKNALELCEFMYEKVKNLDLNQLEVKIAVLKRIQAVYSEINHPVFKDHFVKKFSEYLDIEEKELKRYFQKLPFKRKIEKESDTAKNRFKSFNTEDKLIAYLIQNPEKEKLEKLNEDILRSEINRKILKCVKEGKDCINSDSFSEEEKARIREYLTMDLGINTAEEKEKFFSDSFKKVKSQHIKTLIEKLNNQLKEFEKSNKTDSLEYREILEKIGKLKKEELRLWS